MEGDIDSSSRIAKHRKMHHKIIAKPLSNQYGGPHAEFELSIEEYQSAIQDNTEVMINDLSTLL